MSSVIDYRGSYKATLQAVGERAKQLRLSLELSQQELADRAGIGVATIHRFEKIGNASLENVLRIATALRAEAPLATLFERPEYASIDDVIDRDHQIRRRAPRRR